MKGNVISDLRWCTVSLCESAQPAAAPHSAFTSPNVLRCLLPAPIGIGKTDRIYV